MKNLTWQNPEQLFVAQVLIKKVKLKCCGIKANHNCATCWEANFGACINNTFTYVIGGIYKGGEVPAGMQLFPIHSGKWLKMHFEGGMKAFQEQYEKFHKEWMPAHPEYKWVPNSCCMEWYQGTDIESPDYQCGVMMPIE